jgi:flagellar hook-basal body complex protein FliE
MMQSSFASIQGITGMGNHSPINSVANMTTKSNIGSVSSLNAPSAENAKSFSNLLGDALNNVNTTMQEAQAATDGLLSGDLNNLHEMTIAGAKSEVMLHLTTQIASKLCTSATTLFQMQL